MEKYWVNLLHMYQPPWQKRSVLLEFYQSSYLYTIQTLENNPRLKVSINIAGALTEQLVREKKFNWISRVRKLVDKGQIELVGSAIYHPILPLIPEEEVIRQVKLNEELNSHWFKEQWFLAELNYGGRGFFLPELAYSEEVAKIVASLGFDWLVLDEMSFRAAAPIDWGITHKLKNSSLKLYIRNKLGFEDAVATIQQSKEKLLVTASDGEIYRKPHKASDWKVDWETLLAIPRLNFMTGGEYFKFLGPATREAKPLSGSWQLTEEESAIKSYYHNWNNKDDELHQNLWRLLQEILELKTKVANDANFYYVEKNLDKALASCTWWWVDGRNLGYNPTEVNRGLDMIIDVVRTFKDIDLEERLRFEKLYSEIVYQIWERHWKTSM